MRAAALRTVLVALLAASPSQAAPSAADVLKTSGVKGGLVVHIGCGDGKLTAALHANDRYLVHGLDTDAKNVAKAREYIQSKGLYGKVSVDTFDGKHLPYVDNLVNLLVADQLGGVKMKEVMRVLAPLGVAIVGDKKTVKPWPKEIDEWTHYLHDASGNAVSKDTLVGPPRHLQWVSAPLWPRSHEHTPSISAMVSASGRIIYISDDGVRGVMDSRFPERWALYARDAFSGTLLWKRSFSGWGAKQWKNSKHWNMPMSLPRRLVAVGDRVYVTLGYRAPVSVLDAATGKVLAVFEKTKNTDEILWSDGLLLLRRRKKVPDYPPGATAWHVQMRRRGKASTAPTKPATAPTPLPAASSGDETVVAVRAETGQVLWERAAKRIVTLSLASAGGRVCYHNFEEVVCLDLRNGRELWRAESKTWPDLTGTAGTLVMYEDKVFYAGDRGLRAWSAASGRLLWKGPRIIRTAPRHPPDLFVADGLIWGGMTAQMPTGVLPREQSTAATKPLAGPVVQGLDPMTGRIKRKIDIGKLVSPGHHVRCYRSKATNRFLLWPKRGVEFVDIVDGKNHTRCDWFRGECSYGVMPSGGLIYAPPHPCLCYAGVVLNGFNALAARRADAPGKSDAPRLQRGPAYAQPGPKAEAGPREGDWPMYRHDPARSGSTGSTIGTKLERVWAANPGGRLTSPVIAGGRLLVASVDTHAVRALDAGTGRPLWSYTAGGRVDSSPTIHEGLVLFGCRDGWVYCLRVSDGALAWRFRAAPRERRIVSFEQVESPWPVPGSVLITGGIAYFAAGRSSYLDGGMYLYGLDPKTGKVLHQAHLDGPWPDVAKDVGRPFDMEGAKSDILTSDGTSIYLLFNEFDLQLKKRTPPPPDKRGQRKVGLHLMALSGFLDDTWHDRMFWIYGRQWPGRYWGMSTPRAGQILVFDDTTTYALKAFAERGGMSLKFTPGRAGYTLRADDNNDNKDDDKKNVSAGRAKTRPRRSKPRRGHPPKWLVKIPVRARGMVLAGQTLFLAGPPDTVPKDDPYAAFEGRKGALLWAVSTADGSKLAEYKLKTSPVFDGLVAANGRLYVATATGEIICFGPE